MPNKDIFNHIVQSWDTALKSGDSNSYSVCTIWGKIESDFYLLDVIRERLEYPELKENIIKQIEIWDPDYILIEDKASGQSLLQDLKRELPDRPLIAIQPNKDKVTRFARVTTFFEKRQVFLQEECHWRIQYEEELLSFPNSKANDQVDSTSQYFNFIQNNSNYTPRIR